MKYYLYFLVMMITVGCGEDSTSDMMIGSESCDRLPANLALIDLSFELHDSLTTISGVTVSGSCLTLETRFSGGCEEHNIELLYTESSDAAAMGTQYKTSIYHVNTDPCEALMTQSFSYDLSSLVIDDMPTAISLDGWSQLIIINP